MAWMKYIRPSCMAVVFLTLILTAQAQVNVNVFTDPILRDDYGDIAYENGTILFVAVRDNHTYKAKDASNIQDEGAIGPFYELAASVVDTSLGDDFTSDLVTAIRAKPNFLLVLIHSSLSFGYVLAILVGWLFLIIFPCCCCSACCCGSRNRNRVRPKRKVILVYKYIYLAFVTVLIVFLCVGILLMNSTSDKLSQSLSVHADDVDKIDDIHSYTESTLKQVKALTTYKYDFTVKVVVRDLNNAAAIKATLNELQTGKVELDTAYKSYNTALEALQGRITAQAPQSGIDLKINFNLEM
ncbi:uncharacterized protein LOC131930515, partial [Physella acuta]|uniref:uncharacterized protein LOC131930515 n=1 Tax=Physella acuta TaxID=109671 RepID=UPI0027DCDF31